MIDRIHRHALALAPLLGALVCAVAAGPAAAEPAPAAPAQAPAAVASLHVVKLTNSGKTGITAVYVAPAGSQDLSDDLLGKQTANAGKTVTLKVRDPNAACTFDLQFLMDNGDTVTKKAVNLCQTTAYAFTP